MEEWMKCRVYVHCPGLSRGVLHAHFDKLAPGLVADVHIPIDDRGGGPKHYGFVAFKDRAGLEAALKAGPYQYIGGKKCKVEEARERPQSDRPAPVPARRLGKRAPLGGPLRPPTQIFPGGGVNKGLGPRLHVAQVPSTLSAKDIKNHFKRWGEVTDVYFPKDDDREGKRASYCFVTFKTETAAQEAMNESDRRINGRIVGAITRAAERPEHYNEERDMTGSETGGMLGPYLQGGMAGMLSQNFGYLGGGRDSAWPGGPGYGGAGGTYDNFDLSGFQNLQLGQSYDPRMLLQQDATGQAYLQRQGRLDARSLGQQSFMPDVRQSGYQLQGTGADWLASYQQWPQGGYGAQRPGGSMPQPREGAMSHQAAFASLMDPQGANPAVQQQQLAQDVAGLASQANPRMEDILAQAQLRHQLGVGGAQQRGGAGGRFQMDGQGLAQGAGVWVLDPNQHVDGSGLAGSDAAHMGRAGYGFSSLYEGADGGRGLGQGLMRPQGPATDGNPQPGMRGRD